MKERRKIFSAADLAAIRDGRKTMFREMVVPKPPDGIDRLHGGKLRSRAPYVLRDDNDNPCGFGFQDDQGNYWTPPLGTIGDRLWLPEVWAYEGVDGSSRLPIQYKADRSDWIKSSKWRSAAVMHRGVCRAFAEITGVRVERVQEMEGMDAASSDALKEGVHRIHHEGGNYYYSAFRNQPDPKNWTDPCLAFKELWQSIYANWDANPWVWVYSIKLIKL